MNTHTNTNVKIKICGLSREQDIDAFSKACPDFVGFVFAKSKRQVTPTQAAKLATRLVQNAPTTLQKVGIFVDAPLAQIVDICTQDIIDVVQLHGNEDNAFITALKKRVTVPVIKAIKALSTEYITAHMQNTLADYILLDSVNHNTFGGTGQAFDWSILPPMQKPLFLAGGLDIHNISNAIHTVCPLCSSQFFCVDISSGVETEGIKDPKKIANIIQHVRGLAL